MRLMGQDTSTAILRIRRLASVDAPRIDAMSRLTVHHALRAIEAKWFMLRQRGRRTIILRPLSWCYAGNRRNKSSASKKILVRSASSRR